MGQIDRRSRAWACAAPGPDGRQKRTGRHMPPEQRAEYALVGSQEAPGTDFCPLRGKEYLSPPERVSWGHRTARGRICLSGRSLHGSGGCPRPAARRRKRGIRPPSRAAAIRLAKASADGTAWSAAQRQGAQGVFTSLVLVLHTLLPFFHRGPALHINKERHDGGRP